MSKITFILKIVHILHYHLLALCTFNKVFFLFFPQQILFRLPLKRNKHLVSQKKVIKITLKK